MVQFFRPSPVTVFLSARGPWPPVVVRAMMLWSRTWRSAAKSTENSDGRISANVGLKPCEILICCGYFGISIDVYGNSMKF